jgi:drug/metabolite transporter (DMT)-like permease
MLWVFFTLVASFSQVFRNFLQRRIDKGVNLLTASWSRFVFIFPIAACMVFYSITAGFCTQKFLLLCLAAASLQILGNCLIVSLFRSGHFIVGMTFVKSEVIQTFLIAHFVFGEVFGLSKILALCMASIGLICLVELKGEGGIKALFTKQNRLLIATGIMAGLSFAICGFMIRGSIEELRVSFADRSVFINSMQAVLWMIFLQNIFFAIIKSLQGNLKSSILDIKKNCLKFFIISALSFFGSIFWFLAFGMASVTDIKLVAQVEMIFAILLSHFALKERLSNLQKSGIVLVFSSVILCITNPF